MEICFIKLYDSDKPGNHNFDLLRKLVLPDGSVLRAKLPGRPTRDCLFADPARDGIRFACFLTNYSLLYFPLLSLSLTLAKTGFFFSLLKIWNMNKFTGIVGVFNCQGAGWCKETKKNQIHDTSPGTLTGSVRADDADLISQVAGEDWSGDSIVYAYRSGKKINQSTIRRLDRNSNIRDQC